MSMHLGFVAASTTTAELKGLFLEAFPGFRMVAANDELRCAAEMWEWKEQQEQLGRAVPRNLQFPRDLTTMRFAPVLSGASSKAHRPVGVAHDHDQSRKAIVDSGSHVSS